MDSNLSVKTEVGYRITALVNSRVRLLGYIGVDHWEICLPPDMEDLIGVLKEMKDIYVTNPVVAVRSKGFITKFQEYCCRELRKLISYRDITTDIEIGLHTQYSSKNVDVVSVLNNNGPMIIISVKSQMSSVGKNFIHYYEGAIGDVTSLHKRFPFLSAGMIWLFPLRPIKEGRREESTNFDQIEHMFKIATGRKEYDDDYAKYEYFCMLVVDFEKDPPEIVADRPKDPELRIDDFFSNLVSTFQARTPGIL